MESEKISFTYNGENYTGEIQIVAPSPEPNVEEPKVEEPVVEEPVVEEAKVEAPKVE